MQVRDGNGALYPFAKDCADGIKDPMWLDMPPIRCMAMRSHYLKDVITSSQKNKAMLFVLAVEVGIMHISTLHMKSEMEYSSHHIVIWPVSKRLLDGHFTGYKPLLMGVPNRLCNLCHNNREQLFHLFPERKKKI